MTTDETIANILELLPASLDIPQISYSDDGEIGLFWFKSGNRVEVYLDSEGHLTWVGKFDQRFESGGDVDWSGTIPVGLIQMLRRLAT